MKQWEPLLAILPTLDFSSYRDLFIMYIFILDEKVHAQQEFLVY